NDTAYVQRINRNTGGPIWSQKINKNGSDIAGIVVDDQYLYFVGDSAGVHITQRVNKNTGGPIWSQRVPNGKSKAITQDHSDLYTVKDSSGYAVVSRVNKNTGGPIWSQRIAGHSGSSIAVMGDDIFMMSDSSGNIVLRKINKNTGGPIWSQRVGTGTLGRVTVNYTKGAVYISGTFTGTSSYLGLTSGGGTDGFVARVNKNTGGPVWSQRVGGPGADSIKVLEVTLGSDVYIAGNTQGGTFGNTSAGP
ncbi:MAG: PQQ-like beta-propeller repeat protein, partial [Bacteroidia bacterium]|nr:PQQ-like beta-propeller repeat protein [Bacteroidia bacterium]